MEVSLTLHDMKNKPIPSHPMYFCQKEADIKVRVKQNPSVHPRGHGGEAYWAARMQIFPFLSVHECCHWSLMTK